MNSHHFHPGQRVLCIDGSFHPSVWEYADEVPLEGEIYTISKIRLDGRDNVTGKIGPALGLQEISGTLPGCHGEVCWLTRRFVPLDLQQTNTEANTRSRRDQKKRKISPPRRQLQPTSGALLPSHNISTSATPQRLARITPPAGAPHDVIHAYSCKA